MFLWPLFKPTWIHNFMTSTSSWSGRFVTSDSGSSSGSTSGAFVNLKNGNAFLEGVNLSGLRRCWVNCFLTGESSIRIWGFGVFKSYIYPTRKIEFKFFVEFNHKIIIHNNSIIEFKHQINGGTS